jgi:hypothetical protein
LPLQPKANRGLFAYSLVIIVPEMRFVDAIGHIPAYPSCMARKLRLMHR